jgi:hypothetical protein
VRFTAKLSAADEIDARLTSVHFLKATFFANHPSATASITPEPADAGTHKSKQASDSEFFRSMYTKQQSSRLERIHEGNAFGGSDWCSVNEHSANTFQPGNCPYRLLT